jgi:hypothetical protein
MEIRTADPAGENPDQNFPTPGRWKRNIPEDERIKGDRPFSGENHRFHHDLQVNNSSFPLTPVSGGSFSKLIPQDTSVLWTTAGGWLPQMLSAITIPLKHTQTVED